MTQIHTNVSLLTGLMILVFVGLLFAIPSLLFILGFNLSVYTFYIACAGICCGCFSMRNYFSEATVSWTLVLFSLSVICSVFLAGLFFDISWDGQTYHQEGVIQLASFCRETPEKGRPCWLIR